MIFRRRRPPRRSPAPSDDALKRWYAAYSRAIEAQVEASISATPDDEWLAVIKATSRARTQDEPVTVKDGGFQPVPLEVVQYAR